MSGKPTVSAEKRKAIADLYGQGHVGADVARALGVTQDYVTKTWRKIRAAEQQPATVKPPQCHDDDDWARFVELNVSFRYNRAKDPCDDCLTGFALEMRDEGKCLAWDGKKWNQGIPHGAEIDEPKPPDDQLTRARAIGSKVAVDGRNERVIEAKMLYALLGSNVEVARQMGLSSSTVSHYIAGRIA